MFVKAFTIVTTTDWTWLRAEIRAAAHGFAATLRRLDADDRVPGLDWNVRELGAHVASFPDFYRTLAARSTPMPAPSDFAAFAHDIMSERAHWPIAELADDVVSGFEEWLDELGGDGSAPIMSWVPHIVSGVGGAALNELLVHRRDIAPLTGEDVVITPDQARAILDGLIPMSAAFVDESVARRCRGTFHIGLRGGSDWTVDVVDGGAVVTQGRPAYADVRTSNEPVAMLLTSLGRQPQWKAAATVKMFAWGRKPWLALRFARLFNAP